jgi:hypothetical protein
VPLSVCVQHHPSRAHLLPALLERIDGRVQVVSDPDPESRYRAPLRTYIECLRQWDDDATHRLIVQDDAWPCEGFLFLAEEAVAERPEVLVALFVPGLPSRRKQLAHALKKGERWVRLPEGWTPTVALAWPRAHARAYCAFLLDRYDVARHRGDDGPVGAYRREAKLECWAVVPSLVEHPDVEVSLFGRKAAAGANRARVAAFFRDSP